MYQGLADSKQLQTKPFNGLHNADVKFQQKLDINFSFIWNFNFPFILSIMFENISFGILLFRPCKKDLALKWGFAFV